jgi:O-antigen/teichoic acid export membrane protein
VKLPGGERLRSSLLLQGSAWILIALALQSVLGFAFWVAGSRVASTAELGRASALYTGIQFVNYASGLGLTVALARHAVDRSRESDSLFGWAIGATVVSSMVGGTWYLAASSSTATALVTGSALGWVVFGLYTAGSSIGLLADVRLMAHHRWGFMVGRIAVTGLVRLALVPFGGGIDPDVWLYHLMLAPLAIGGVVAALLLPRVGAGRISFARPAGLASVARYSGVNWAATLASQAPQFVLPLVVAQSVASSTYANFFLAWTVTGLVFLVPGAIAQVLLVEGAKDATGHPDHEPRPDRAREALAFSLGLAVLALVGAIVAGQLMVVLFGDGYRSAGETLPLLMAAGIPWSIAAVRLSEARIRRDQLATVAITMTLGLGILVPTVAWVPDHGTGGAVAAWLLGNGAAALVAVVLHQRRRSVSRLGVASG